MIGKVNEKKVPDEDATDTDSLEFLLQRDVSWTQDLGVADPWREECAGEFEGIIDSCAA